jgi:ABC-type sugar transport system permease subunit
MKKNSFLSELKRGKWGYLMIAPLMIGLLVFCYYPSFYGLGLSFFDKKSSSPAVFCKFDNFVKLFHDEIFLNSIWVMFKIMIPKLLIGVFMPLVMAELIFAVSSKKAQGAYRVLILLPIVAPGVVSMLIWRNVFNPSDGLLTTVVRLFGFVAKDEPIDWLGNPDLVLFSIIFMGFPWIGGTSVLIYTSGLMDISEEVIEASRLDGASTITRIFRIDLPLLAGQLRYFFIFGIIGGFQDYGVQYVLTDGGPGYSSYVPGWYMYKLAFSYDNMGYAASIGTLLFIVIFAVSGFMLKYMNIGGMREKNGGVY